MHHVWPRHMVLLLHWPTTKSIHLILRTTFTKIKWYENVNMISIVICHMSPLSLFKPTNIKQYQSLFFLKSTNHAWSKFNSLNIFTCILCNYVITISLSSSSNPKNQAIQRECVYVPALDDQMRVTCTHKNRSKIIELLWNYLEL